MSYTFILRHAVSVKPTHRCEGRLQPLFHLLSSTKSTSRCEGEGTERACGTNRVSAQLARGGLSAITVTYVARETATCEILLPSSLLGLLTRNSLHIVFELLYALAPQATGRWLVLQQTWCVLGWPSSTDTGSLSCSFASESMAYGHQLWTW
jgi:hypothetical protein